MMQFKRTERVNDLVRMEVAEILMRKVKDPRIGFVTVTGVDVSDDLQHAKVFVSVPEDRDRKKILSALSKASGYVRTELGKRLKLRYTPELNFLPDDAYLRSQHVLELLDELRKKEKTGE
ncbi:MAG TPA: 30S ribosome-binding factor RbfA [Nitrospiria bacterium]|nr:30S ribosome-binding factor RbfA [Nitrospiria bacterium]